MQLSPVPVQRQAPVVIPGDVPVYRIKEGKFFGPDDTLYNEGAIIVWEEEPNLDMEPMNDLAKETMRGYLKKLDDYGREAAKKVGKFYNSLADAYENSIALAKSDSRQVRLLTGSQHVPLMGGKKKATSLKQLEMSDTDAPPLSTPKKGKFSLKREARDEVNGIDGSND